MFCYRIRQKDISIIVEAIIEKQIKYVEGEYVQGLSFQKIESNKEQDKSGKYINFATHIKTC